MTITAGKFASKIGSKKSKLQMLIEGLAPYALTILIGYFVADLGIIYLRQQMLPQTAPPSRPPVQKTIATTSKDAYQSIVRRNIFTADGLIPDALSDLQKKDGKKQEQDAPPVLSTLPLQLLGTLVHSNPAKSIATIDLKGKGVTLAISPNKDIENMATILKVERNKVIFRNLNNGRLEYIENKSNSKISFAAAMPSKPEPILNQVKGEIQQLAPNKYKLSRATLLKHTSDLGSLVMKASSMPRTNAKGEIDGFIITSFQPDSIFAELGIQPGDVITGVNGEKLDSIQKVMALYEQLKVSSNIKLMVESDGRPIEKDYSIE